MRRAALPALAVAAALVVAGCNPAAKKTSDGAPASTIATFGTSYAGQVKTSGFNPSDEVGKARAGAAEKKIAPATVSMDTTNFDAQKFAAQAQAGNVPDLIQVDRAGLATLADKNLIMPLDACYKAHDMNPVERYYDAAIKDVTYDGHVYGVPQFFQPSLIIGNQRLMQAAGVTAADLDTSKPDALVAAAQKMYKANGGAPSVIGFDPDLPGSTTAWLAAFGGRPYDENGKPTLDDPKNVKALTLLKQLVDAQGGYATMKSFKDAMDVFGDKNPYAADQVGAQLWAQWYINVLANTKDKVSLVGVPLRDADGKTIGVAGGTALAIPAKSKNPTAACAWALAVTSPEAWQAAGKARSETVAKKNSLNTGVLTASPVADKAIREEFVKPSGNAQFDQLIDTAYDALGNTVSFGSSPVGQQLTDALKNAATAAVMGEKSPEEALKDAQATTMRAWEQSNLGKRR